MFNRSHVSIGRASTPQSLYYCMFAPHICIVVLRAHPIRGETHNQRNATGEVATGPRSGNMSQNGQKPTSLTTSFTKSWNQKTNIFHCRLEDLPSLLRAWTALWCNRLRSYDVAKTHGICLVSGWFSNTIYSYTGSEHINIWELMHQLYKALFHLHEKFPASMTDFWSFPRACQISWELHSHIPHFFLAWYPGILINKNLKCNITINNQKWKFYLLKIHILWQAGRS